MPEPLLAACLAFTAGPDIRANAERIRDGIERAARGGARLLLTPETALVGYPGHARPDLEAVDWQAVASLEDSLAEAALERGVSLVLGTASPWGEGISNDALLCGAVDREHRYRKRCLTPLDHEHFLPADQPVVAAVAGWRIGLAVCYDVRFPDVWADLALDDAQLFCCIGHMAGNDPDPGTKPLVVAAHFASRAAELATPLLFCNTAASDRWLDSALWDARGLQVANRGEDLLATTVLPREHHDPWYAGIRGEALRRWGRRLGRAIPG